MTLSCGLGKEISRNFFLNPKSRFYHKTPTGSSIVYPQRQVPEQYLRIDRILICGTNGRPLTLDFSSEKSDRVRRLRRWLSANELDAAVFLKEDIEQDNCNYVYYGGDLAAEEYAALVIDTSGNTSAVVQEHAFERASASGMFQKVISTRQSTEQLVSHVKELIESHNHGRVVVDGSASANTTRKLQERVQIESSAALTNYVYAQRSIKSAYEIKEIDKAIRIGRKALEKTVHLLRAGDKIKGIARNLKKSMLDEGAVGESFPTGITIMDGVSEKKITRIKDRSLILFDFGARLESQYLSDMGRTIGFRPDSKIRDFLGDVYQIKRLGLLEIKSGRDGNKVRREIDRIIGEFGYGSVHRPGHQIGLNVHEPYEPNLAYGEENRKPLKESNVVTWEPGIGVKKDDDADTVRTSVAHLEDMVLVSQDSKMLGNVPLDFQ